MERVTDEQIEHWFEHGYVIVPDFLTPAELKQAREGFRLQYPTWAEYKEAPDRYANLPVWREFPFASEYLNLLTVHPALIELVQTALGANDVFVTQALLWGKYAGHGNWEQEHHMDYGNNTLVVPRDEGEFRQVAMIMYYEDVDLDLGPTRVVSQKDTAHLPTYPLVAGKEAHPEVYEKEVPVTVTAGSLMLYTQATYHRGTAMTAKEGARFSHHIVWRRAGFEWMGFRAFPREGNDPNMAAFLTAATPAQRTVVGFPAPGHPYWNEATIAGVQKRYADMDMTPYREALT